MKRIYLLLIILTIVFPLMAQSSDYQKRADQVRMEVWSWDNPAFKNYEIPDEFKNESAVILAYHRQIDATASKSTFAKQFFLGSNAGKLFYTDIDRKMIRINDQEALNRYSEFSFKEESKFGFFRVSNSAITILGARIIKPDGSIKEIDVSKMAVAITEGKKDKEAYKKLAIPELQINDILDYFICDIYELETVNMPEQFIPFYSVDYPALNYSYSLTFGKNLTIEYRSINGAPEFSKGTDSNGNISLTSESNNIMRINDAENIRWLLPSRDIPMIRFIVLQNASKAFFKPKSARPIGVYENVPYETIIEDAKYFLAYQNSKLSPIRNTPKKIKEIINNYQKVKPNLSKEELANVIYTALNFEWPVRRDLYYNSSTFMLVLNNLFKEYEIDSKIGFATNKYSARKDEILTADDLTYLIVANEETQYFFAPYRYRVPGEIPNGLQGEFVSTFVYQHINPSLLLDGSMNVKGFWSNAITLPESSSEDNSRKTQLQISFNPDDIHKIDIQRHSVWLGDLKIDIQYMLLLFEDWDKELRSFLQMEVKSYIDELNKKKNTRKFIQEVEGSFEKSREEYAETIEGEIMQYHGFAPDKVKNYSFSSLGVTLAKPQLEYNISYTMNDFVRIAGENIIFAVGKLIGKQWNPTENERNRNTNAYLPTPRIFENEILIQVPTEYFADNIEHLNVRFSNKYATFEAVAGIENTTITIKTKKIYHQTFIPKEEWQQLVDIIDKTNEFYASSIIFQKKN